MSHELDDGSNAAFSSGFILRSMEHKSILITGSTGFLAKIFIEKVLRIQPRVKKLYLLLRASEKTSATERFQQEVIEKELFSVLRGQHGEGFDSFISSKVVPLAGDISSEKLGIKDLELEQKMLKEIDFIVNIAANTNWEERYDVALSINTLGAKHIYEFAKKCQKLELLLHVSTAYVSTEKEGVIYEKPLRMGERYNGSSGTLDIETELKIAEEQLKQLRKQDESEGATTIFMKKLGMQRARLHGWVNTYVFTKAMGEMLLRQLREDYAVPLVIVRPTIITSTYSQPFPGWIEGFKTIDAVVHSYAKGGLTHFLADPNSIMDVIPGDMVVNAMLAAMAAHCNLYHQGITIYNVGSSTRNPIKYTHLTDWAFDYFSTNPHMDLNGNPIRVPRLTVLPSKKSLSNYLKQNYELPLEALQAKKDLTFDKSSEYLYSKLNRQYILLTRLLEYFEPFVLFKGIFNSSNLENLGDRMREEDLKDFDFDPICIDWEDYFKTVHFPGSTKYAFTRSKLLPKSIS